LKKPTLEELMELLTPSQQEHLGDFFADNKTSDAEKVEITIQYIRDNKISAAFARRRKINESNNLKRWWDLL
jgi:hypothetical protein